jgi:hypothetical protein
MQTFFIIISVIGLIYFFFVKRRFDWFAVAFISACVYFLPGFFGYTSYLTLSGWDTSPINDTAYGIMLLVETAVLSGAVVNDLLIEDKGARTIAESSKGNGHILAVFLFLSLFGMGMMLLTTGSAIFDTDKQAMLAQLNRWYILFYTAVMLGCVLSFEYGNRVFFALFCLLALFDVFVGFRMAFALIGIGITTLWLFRRGKQRLLLSSWKPLIAVPAVALFLFFYKQIQFAVKYGDVALLKNLIFDPATYAAMFTQSEPFVVQSILNEVTQQNYTVGMGHLAGVLYQFILFSPELGMDAISFNDLFQPALFPESDYGMANNIWAEMWSSGGWPLLVLFVIVFVMVLKLLSVVTQSDRASKRAVVAVMASCWAFYIHRNDITYQIALEKRIVLIAALAFSAAFFIKKYLLIPHRSMMGSPSGGDP